jgi:hypothetical protein
MKNIYLIIVLYFFWFIINSCNSTSTADVKNNTMQNKDKDTATIYNESFSEPDKQSNTAISGNDPLIPIVDLKMSVRRGDTNAYNKLYIAYLTHEENMLFWSLLMANKYDYTEAYFDVFCCLMNSYNCVEYKLDKMDDKSKKIALYYLRMAADKGHKQAIEVIKDYFPNLSDIKKTTKKN